ncbi:hypothetical protein G6O69_04285 [Pseudenhygromyxa sp. WMMC2535]|uniref:hypothetical protein n=1 Tax=Pseudenhygromyxa sp. WMMC2535 TaxID=2712867 RepID=UPI0015573526|nr:hypothetical protein [Pseudenhygromyxa sp. WMMC2535]NVB37036.1 hypothetical protein [Pseudenhygromyxa sp. WMMC2535]
MSREIPTELTLEIASLSVSTSLERERAEGLGPALERAFAALAERLRQLPGGEQARLDALLIERLELELDDAESLLGPGGPEALAERLLDRLLTQAKGGA